MVTHNIECVSTRCNPNCMLGINLFQGADHDGAPGEGEPLAPVEGLPAKTYLAQLLPARPHLHCFLNST